MKPTVLFLGGTGIISSACSRLAIERGLDLYPAQRGTSTRAVPEGAAVLRGDIRDPAIVRDGAGQSPFDAVVDWIAFTPEHIETDIELFRGRAGPVCLYQFRFSLSDSTDQPADYRIYAPR